MQQILKVTIKPIRIICRKMYRLERLNERKIINVTYLMRISILVKKQLVLYCSSNSMNKKKKHMVTYISWLI